jgi:hypothetical protein
MIATTGRVSVRATYTHRVLPHLRGEGDKDIICQQTSANITQITSSEQHLPNCFMGFFPVAFWNVVAWILRRGLARLAPNFDCQSFFDFRRRLWSALPCHLRADHGTVHKWNCFSEYPEIRNQTPRSSSSGGHRVLDVIAGQRYRAVLYCQYISDGPMGQIPRPIMLICRDDGTAH